MQRSHGQWARRLFAPALLLVTAASAAGAQNVPVRHYDKPLWTSAEGFTQPTALRELQDGRVIVTDTRDIEIWLLSSTGTRVRQIGRRGGGPQEFQMPAAALALPNDSTLIVDPDQARFLLLDGTGKPITTIAPPNAVLSAATESARSTDQQGRVYFTIPFATENPRVPLMRWDRATNRVDTVATLTAQLPDKKPRVVKGIEVDGGRMDLVAHYYSAFPSEDGWIVLPDGTVIVIRATDFHADVISPTGAVRAAAAIPAVRVFVTAAERKKYGPRIQSDLKPLFIADGVRASPDGEVWVPHYRAEAATVTRWDVLNMHGARIATVEAPHNTTVLAVTRTRVYFSRTDGDGLHWIEAHARTTPPPRS